MIRVLKGDGLLFLILPSSGPEHRYPVDCYRFLPDSFAALAKYADAFLVEAWHDQRGPWRDVVGVMAKTSETAARFSSRPESNDYWYRWARNSAPGTSEEESKAGEEHYLDTLARIHQQLDPNSYLEIGVRNGLSLAVSRAESVGVDPRPEITVDLPDRVSVCRETSDDFFAARRPESSGFKPDLAFIDGMHLFEFALRDFMNLERMMSPAGLIVVDDVFPNHPVQASRIRQTQVWTGDIWKLHEFLALTRTDLFFLPLDSRPTGVLLISGLDPQGTSLWDRYNPLVRGFLESSDSSPPDSVLRRRGAVSPRATKVADLLSGLRDLRNRDASSAEVKAFLASLEDRGR
jgi:predicted O-methyltransferase YrrM